MVTSPRQPHDNQQNCHNDVVRGETNQKASKGHSSHSDGEQDSGAEAVNGQARGKLADAIGNIIGKEQATRLGIREKKITADEWEKRREQRRHQMMAKMGQHK